MPFQVNWIEKGDVNFPAITEPLIGLQLAKIHNSRGERHFYLSVIIIKELKNRANLGLIIDCQAVNQSMCTINNFVPNP